MEEHILTQKEQIRRYLAIGWELNHMEALKMFGCARLAARINDLRAEGITIDTRIVHNKITNKRYAAYRMVPEQKLSKVA